MLFEQEASARVTIFADVVGAKVMSSKMAIKASNSGLTFCHLQLAAKHPGGIPALFKEPGSAGVRVSKNRRIIQAMSAYLMRVSQ